MSRSPAPPAVRQVSATVGLNRDLTRSGVLDVGGKGPVRDRRRRPQLPVVQAAAASATPSAAAKTRVEAGRATLRAVEGDVFTEAVAAYMDVIRDRAIVELNANNVRVLTTNLQATRDRFEIGDLTRTDVAQSEARLQLGRAQLATAQGRLTASEAELSPGHRQAARRARAAAAAAAAAGDRRGGGADRARQQSRPDRHHAPGRGRRL